MLDRSTRLVDAFALLVMRDEDGKRLVGTDGFDAGLGGALVAELAISGRVSLEDKRIEATNREPLGDPLLDGTLSRIASESSERKASWWVRKLGTKELRERVLAELVERGALREETTKALGLISVNRYPAGDGQIEDAVRDAVLSVLRGDTEPDPRTAALIGICDATGVLKKAFGAVPKDRVKAVLEGEWAAPAVRKVINDCNAVVYTTLIAIVASSHAAQGI